MRSAAPAASSMHCMHLPLRRNGPGIKRAAPPEPCRRRAFQASLKKERETALRFLSASSFGQDSKVTAHAVSCGPAFAHLFSRKGLIRRGARILPPLNRQRKKLCLRLRHFASDNACHCGLLIKRRKRCPPPHLPEKTSGKHPDHAGGVCCPRSWAMTRLAGLCLRWRAAGYAEGQSRWDDPSHP